MAKLEEVILRDTTINRPAPGIEGRLFYDITLGKLQRDSGVDWEDIEGTGSGFYDEITLIPKASSSGVEGTIYYDSDDDHVYVATE